MNLDISTTSPDQSMAHEVSAVLHAIQPESMAENTRQVKALSRWAEGAQQAEHIRAVVAVTMGHNLLISTLSSVTTQ
ncbi:MAG: hypothetical protein LH632_22715 [Rhodoferax sp.]|nr:hypothetical protein [Rhodoferax sp.]